MKRRRNSLFVVCIEFLGAARVDILPGNTVGLRQPPTGIIHHAGRGSQYCSHDYRKLLAEHGMHSSMSGKGNCYDNSMMETVFKTIKSELIWRASFQTRQPAKTPLADTSTGSTIRSGGILRWATNRSSYSKQTWPR